MVDESTKKAEPSKDEASRPDVASDPEEDDLSDLDGQ